MRLHLLTLLLVGTCFLSAQSETLQLQKSVFFATASDRPDAAATADLTAFASSLKAYADYELRVAAYTDEQGTTDYNEDLARRRAARVQAILTDLGVAATIVDVATYGERQARQQTTSDAERQPDRRVDLEATVTLWPDATAAIAAARQNQRQALDPINPADWNTLRGSQGGVCQLPPNALVRPDGKPALGPVTIELTEAYDLADMVIAGLTTTSDGKRLITGGMIRITATDADGTSLHLRDGMNVRVSIPTDDFNERMRIFTGSGHATDGPAENWELTQNGVTPSLEDLAGATPPPPPTPETVVLDEEAQEEVRQRRRRWTRDNPKPVQPRYFDPNKNYVKRKPRDIDTSRIAYQPQGLQRIFMSKKRRQEETAEKQAKAQRSYNRRLVRYQESLTFQATIAERNAKLRADYERDLENWNFRRMEANGTFETAAGQAYLERLRARRAELVRVRAERVKAFEEELAAADNLGNRQGDISRYFFEVSQLGWVNVDIFHGEEDTEEVLATIPGSTDDATVLFLPQDQRSVLAYSPREDKWSLSGIPQRIAYHVVAYEVIDGKLMFAHKLVDSGRSVTQKLAFAPVAVGELKDKIAALVGS
ncbi:MAG: OmpA family protein [Bacteroidota bacterium]